MADGSSSYNFVMEEPDAHTDAGARADRGNADDFVPRATTTAIEARPSLEERVDNTSGLVLIYSKSFDSLPSTIAFNEDITTIGRSPYNTFCLQESAVSRHHVQAERREDGTWLVDTSSTNGTFRNGRRINTCLLEEHDVVRIGDSIFRFASRGIDNYANVRLSSGRTDHPIVGGYQLQQLLERARRAAASGLTIVILGESGTGKELLAREVHRASGRGGPFQAINCAALPATLLESELFGYKKGSFTGASTDKLGLVQIADGGTLFLDEIGDMPLEAQAKLLRVLQERELMPVGATTAVKVDVRVVCATHRNLEERVQNGHFRGDLFARLREFTVQIPPLRHRKEDLYPLVTRFLATQGKESTELSLPFMLALAHYDWPYNVRELENAIKMSLALVDRGSLELAHLPEPLRKFVDERTKRVRTPVPASKNSRFMPSEEHLRMLLSLHRGNIAAVSRELGKERMQIHRWLKKFHIDIGEYRSDG